MFPNQQNPSGNGYPPQYPQGGQPQQPQYGSHEVLPPLTNTGASGHNPYEFIMNPASKKRGLGFGGGGGAGKKFVIIACVAVLVIVLIAATLMSALAPKGSTPALISIAQHQQEIIRIADDASDKVSTQNAANFVINAELTVTTSQTEVLTYLRSHSGKKLNSKTLSLTKNLQTDTLLANAISANTYDTVVVQELTSELTTYEKLIQTTYTTTTSKSTKDLLQKTFTNTEALVAQAQSLQPATN